MFGETSQINPGDVSVILQGPIVHAEQPADRISVTTANALKSIRAVLPDSELILSTWEGQDTSGLDFDSLVLSKDPGSLPSPPFNLLLNTARQIVSTRAGLSRTTRPFSLKLRTDTALTSSAFIELWRNGNRRGLQPPLLTRKVLISAIFSSNPTRTPNPYCVSDFFYFGKTEDVRKLWEVRLPKYADTDFWDTCIYSRFWQFLGGQTAIINGINTEQFLFLSFLREAGIHVNLRRRSTLNPFSLMRSDWLIARGFVVVNPAAAGIELPPRFLTFVNHRTYRTDLKSGIFCAKSPAIAFFALWLRFPLYVAICLREPFRRVFSGASHLVDVHLVSQKESIKQFLVNLPGGRRLFSLVRSIANRIKEW